MVKASTSFTPLFLLKVWDIINLDHVYFTNTVHPGRVLKTKISAKRKEEGKKKRVLLIFPRFVLKA